MQRDLSQEVPSEVRLISAVTGARLNEFVAKAAQVFFGEQGLLISSVIVGLTDVDVIAISVGEIVTSGGSDALDRDTAVLAIVLAAIANTMSKGVMALVLGGKALGWRVLVAFTTISVVGAVIALL